MPLVLYPPRRLLVSPDGTVHDPVCRRVPATAESRGWGELANVEHAISRLLSGQSIDSTRRGVLPGPKASSLCSNCLASI